MIVLTGATGNIGRPLVERLTAAGEKLTVVSRSAAPSTTAVTHVRAALADPASLGPAFGGADALFLLTPGPQFDLPAIVEEARRAGIGRIVYVSSQRVASRPEEGLEAIESPVAESGLEWTILRPGGFASNAMLWADRVRRERAVAAPFGDVALPVVDPADIADAAAAVLLEDGHHGERLTLTGPEPISPRLQAEAIGEAIGEPVAFTEQTRDEAFAALSRIRPAEVVEGTLKVLGAPNGIERAVTGEVERLTGRPGRTFAEWARRHASAFR